MPHYSFYGLDVSAPPTHMHQCEQVDCRNFADFRFTIFKDGKEVAVVDLCERHALNNGVTGIVAEEHLQVA